MRVRVGVEVRVRVSVTVSARVMVRVIRVRVRVRVRVGVRVRVRVTIYTSSPAHPQSLRQKVLRVLAPGYVVRSPSLREKKKRSIRQKQGRKCVHTAKLETEGVKKGG